MIILDTIRKYIDVREIFCGIFFGYILLTKYGWSYMNLLIIQNTFVQLQDKEHFILI